MNIFQIKTLPDGHDNLKEFIKDRFICIGYTGVGDLTGADKGKIRNELYKQYDWTGSQLGNHLGIVNAFVNTMKKDDIVLMSENSWVHIGRLDDYYYDSNHILAGKCHRRNVEWLATVRRDDLNERLRELLKNRSIITKFKHPYQFAEMDLILSGNKVKEVNRINITSELAEEAVKVLEETLQSANESLRVQAAVEILRYYK